MNKFFLLPFNARIAQYKRIRNECTDKPLETQVNIIYSWFNEWPIVNHCVDPYDCKRWSTPWEMIKQNEICEDGKQILLHQTLCLLDSDFHNYSAIFLMRDYVNETIGLGCYYKEQILGKNIIQFNPKVEVEKVFIKTDDWYIEMNRAVFTQSQLVK